MFEYAYDILHRPIQSKVLGGDDASNVLDHIVERVFYGENEANAKVKNLRGQVIKHYDTGGLVETPAYNFKGEAESSTRRLFKHYKKVTNWTDANLVQDLEDESYTFTTLSDALGRISKQTAPDGSVITPSYNKAGLLESEKVLHSGSNQTPRTYIKNIDYDEKGQRSLIEYGNNVVTRYTYDEKTFRLKHLESEKGTKLLQDLYYTYDPVGNISEIEDKSHSTAFYDNQQVNPNSTYTYDALYRLIEATGRENKVTATFGTKDNWKDAEFMKPNDPIALRRYTQSYGYDEVGNIAQMKHIAANASWTRDYAYETDNNRLKNTQVGTETYTYPHHAKHGYIESMPHLQEMGWNFKEELIKTIRQRVTSGGTAETTYYQYDGSGQRIRKITENQADAGDTPTKKEERIYIAGYEVYKKHSGSHAGLERTTLSLMEGDHRFVMVERRYHVDDGTEEELVRYQMHNHLGSSALELDQQANIISYEEYHPYGTTAYQAMNKNIKAIAKRYRYTGMERDEESGLSYHSTRYYLPWLGRWVSGDPIGIGDGVNVYGYAQNSPIRLKDVVGTQASHNATNDDASRSQVNSGSSGDGEAPVGIPKVIQSSQKAGTVLSNTVEPIVKEILKTSAVKNLKKASQKARASLSALKKAKLYYSKVFERTNSIKSSRLKNADKIWKGEKLAEMTHFIKHSNHMNQGLIDSIKLLETRTIEATKALDNWAKQAQAFKELPESKLIKGAENLSRLGFSFSVAGVLFSGINFASAKTNEERIQSSVDLISAFVGMIPHPVAVAYDVSYSGMQLLDDSFENLWSKFYGDLLLSLDREASGYDGSNYTQTTGWKILEALDKGSYYDNKLSNEARDNAVKDGADWEQIRALEEGPKIMNAR